MEWLYGRRPVYESLRAGRRRFQRLLIAEGVKQQDLLADIEKLAAGRRVSATQVPRARFEEMLGDVNHQGVALEASAYPYSSLPDISAIPHARGEPAFVLILDHLQDPQNLGSILRSAEAAGVHGVFLPDRRAALITPAVVRASAGASEHLAVAAVPNLVNAMRKLKEDGVWFSGLDAGPESRLYAEADLDGPVGLVIGNEGDGLGRLVGENCDFRIRLPMLGRVDSLNAGAAAAVALYEVRRRRLVKKPA